MDICTYCLSHQIWITAKHLPGLMNSEADYASRNFNNQHRVDVGSHYLSTNYNSILHTGSGPFRHAFEPSGSPVCSTLSRSRSSGDRRLLARLESLDSIYSPPIILIPNNSHANETRQDNRATNSPTLARPTLVSKSYGDVGRLSSTITSSPNDNFPSTRPRGSTPIGENRAISSMANFRSRLDTAGLPEVVCQVIMASWQKSTQQRFEGSWKVWTSWCVQRQK